MCRKEYLKICITNRHLVEGDFWKQFEKVMQSDVDYIILREKDLTKEEYLVYAKMALEVCKNAGKRCILHSFVEEALLLGADAIHLTYQDFMQLDDKKKQHFSMIGVSTHTVEEAVMCERNGASYVTASHIFPTACKEGLAPKGLLYLKDVVNAVKMPVFALGGIHEREISLCIEAGAAGVCQMSEYMKM